MKKILFGITGLTLGGAERVLIDVANNLCEKYDITIFTIYAKGELEKQLSSKVRHQSLYDVAYNDLTKWEKINKVLKILFFKKSIYNKNIKEYYDVEIAFLEGPITRILSTENKSTKKIAWIHNDISNVFGNNIKAKMKRKLDKRIYEKYEKLVFVSKDNMEQFNKVYSNINKEKEEVIYNYIDKQSILKKTEEEIEINFDTNQINFITIARLVPQKAIDRIISVHSKLIKEGVHHKFYVIGDGPEKIKLEEKIKMENVESTFILLGQKENPYPYVKKADCFCLLSNFEGYGMVLEEAKILNKPIIITNTAAREAVEKYEMSIVLENTENAIYKGLKKIILNPQFIKERKKIKYDNSNIIEKIEKIIEN